jgi:hypothetical protein
VGEGRYWLQTLGCPKNQVDSDKLAGRLAAQGYQRAADPAEADLVVVNTCAFIESARQESIDTVLELADLRSPGARLVVTGCMAERYGAELTEALPEVDLVAGFGTDFADRRDHDDDHAPELAAVPVSLSATPRPREAQANPTAASSTAYQFQVSTPNAIVVPTPPRPVPVPAASAPVAPPVATSVTPGVVTVRRHRFPRGLVRRAWLLALALVAGSAGGWFAGVHAGTTYGAQATLVVQSGAGKTGPGSANDALALATTYSALIPKDQSILSTAAGALNMSTGTVERNLSVTVESGTSLLLVDFSAPSATLAVAGADAVARAVASRTPLTAAIAAGSVAVVSLPGTAHRQGTLHKYGIELGGFLGLVVGLILVLAAERADPRIDDGISMAAATGCRAALVPNDLSFAELARVLSDVGTGKGLTVVPIAISDTAPTMVLARELRPCWPANGPAVAISPSFSSGVIELSRGSGPTVLVSHPGTRQRDVVAAAERLRMIGRPPVWAVLANRRLRSRVSDRVG